ncbi:MAG: hypothetical protein A3J49_01540 [Gallionellales bacterium RIFCSPHIGHO2_02_FULL_57_16]|nr:MAG: hypothetical protein A3J49_01540 [Gallionellales bacterium RIFCSPHIGHO2_02_FULL_57_16]
MVLPSNIDKLTVEGEQPVSLCNYVDVYKNDKITADIEFMPATATGEQIRKLSLTKGDVVLTKDSESPWDIAVPTYIAEDIPNLVCGYHLAKLAPNESLMRGNFLCWALKSFPVSVHFSLAASGITRHGLSIANISDGNIPVPSTAEQQAIADYLDRETARIDMLIAEKEQLIDTLREYRQATIDSALARGLKEGVTIVSTKQAWWGSIPQHWTLLPLKRIVGIRITDGPHETPELVEQGVPFVSAEAIKGGRVDFNQRRGNITPELHEIFCKKARPRRGDVFVVKSGATTGNVGFVDTDDEFSIWSPLALVRYSDGYSDGRYLFWAMSSNAFRLAVRMHWSAGTQPNLGMAVLENLSIPVPPFDEQRAIAAYLDHETARIDKLVYHVQDEIKLLQELRAATITDAVTGKIQVS